MISNKILLSLDQSSKLTGYAIFEDNVLVHSGVINIRNTEFNKRLLNLYSEVKELITNFKINYVILEDIQLDKYVSNNVNTFKVLSKVMGALELLLTQLEIPYEIIYSSSWRSKCEIRGKTRPQLKQAAQAFVRREYGLDVSEDEADAICIGVSTFYNKNSFDWN